MTGPRLPSLFWLLALTNLFVGGMVGLERTLVVNAAQYGGVTAPLGIQ